MCGRYSFYTEDDNAEINKIIHEINTRYPDNQMRTGEIFPTHLAPILMEEGNELHADLAGWGFPRYHQKGVIINARSETAGEKKTFRDSLINRRCVIPSTGFFEWSQNEAHQKYLFRVPDEQVLYMAGLYNEFQGERRYVILTAEGNESIRDVHHRMPVVLLRDQLRTWTGRDPDGAEKLLRTAFPSLTRIPV